MLLATVRRPACDINNIWRAAGSTSRVVCPYAAPLTSVVLPILRLIGKKELPPGFEPELLDSKSKVITNYTTRALFSRKYGCTSHAPMYYAEKLNHSAPVSDGV